MDLSDLMPLPEDAAALLERAQAPDALRLHLKIVHDVAARLCAGLREALPDVPLDAELVCFGAAIHDIGKAQVPEELSAPGKRHEALGERLLVAWGVAPERARFARTHGLPPDAPALTREDRAVVLADKIWKGARRPDLEQVVLGDLGAVSGLPAWDVFMRLDALLVALAHDAPARLALTQR